ncbi:g1822 [Coccomyxa elongata]
MDSICSDVRHDPSKDAAHIDISTFTILPAFSSALEEKTRRPRSDPPYVDQDGDLVLDRCHQVGKAVAIHHACSTDLSRVGLQVWPGALLLADYILEHEKHFDGCVGMEVGAGTGFAGLVLAQSARRVFLTDHDAGVMCNCQRNVEANASEFRHGPGVALVRHLDLFHAVPSDPGKNLCAGRHSGITSADTGNEAQETFQWRPENLADLADLQVILAADIIYDDDLTEAFMRLVESFLMPDQSKPGLQRTLLLATEKRYNITMYDAAPQPHAYLFFRDLFRAEGEELHLN